jgi:hypothetical protein
MRNSLHIERTRQRSLRNPLRACRTRWTSMRNSLRIERTRQRSMRNALRARRTRWTSSPDSSPGFEPVSARCATRCGLVEPVGHPRPIRRRSSPDGSVSGSTRRHGPNPAAFPGQRVDLGRTRQRFGVNASTFAPLGQRVDVFPLRAFPCGRASCTPGQRRQRFRRRARVSALTTMRTPGALAANVSACRSWQFLQTWQFLPLSIQTKVAIFAIFRAPVSPCRGRRHAAAGATRWPTGTCRVWYS